MVRPDGRISMPLIGELTANGLTVNQLELAIADLLKKNDLIKTPQVTVQVTQINSKKYFIQGEVLRQGAFPLVVPTTVLEALVNAGFKDFANVKKIEIIRGTERLRFNYKDVIHGRHMEQNIMLKPGDMIIVP
jgi:polysaccharide export outer membrane protein